MKTMHPNLEGFRPLRFGKIHLRCPKCGRKQANQGRQAGDPPKAVLMELLCPECVNGNFDMSTYRDGDYNEVPQ